MGLTGSLLKRDEPKEPTKIVTRFVQVREKCIGLATKIWNADPRQALSLGLVYLLLPASFVLQLAGKASLGWYLFCSVVTACYFAEHWLTPKRRKKK